MARTASHETGAGDQPKAGRIASLTYPKYFLLLAAAVLVGLLGVTALLLLNNRMIIWKTDGLPQALNGLICEGRLLRSAFASLIAGNGFDLQQYVFDLGFGGSTNTVVRLFDPLGWLTVFVPGKLMEYFYYFLIFARTYLAAAFFSLYCFGRKRGKGPTFVAALCYAFCGYALLWGILRHPHFLNAAWLLPLVFYGADRLFANKGPVAFVLATGLMFFMSSYFAYMICLALLVYCLGRYFLGDRERSVRDFLVLVGKFVASGLLGAALAAISIMPSVISLLSMDRVSGGSKMYIAPMFGDSYYQNLILNFLGGRVSGANARFIGPVAMLMLIVLVFCGKKFDKHERRPLLFCLAVAMFPTLVPFFSHVMNGMNYPTDRWMFILEFFTSYSVCLAVPALRKLEKLDWVKVGVACVVVLGLAAWWNIGSMSWQSIDAVVSFAVVAVLAIALVPTVFRNRGGRVMVALLAVAVIGTASLTSFFALSPSYGGGYQSAFPKGIGTAYSTFTSKSPFQVVESQPAELRERYRYSMPSNFDSKNKINSLTQKRMGLDFYSSSYNQSVANFRKEIGIANRFSNNYYFGSDNRLALDAFSAARYYVGKETSKWKVPATYEPTGDVKKEYSLYETDVALDRAFTYAAAISRDDYEKLDMAGKAEAVLEGCVLKGDDIDSDANMVEPVATAVRPETEVTYGQGIAVDGDKLKVTEAGATMTFTFEPVPNAEIYVGFEDVMPVTSHVQSYELAVKCADRTYNLEPLTPYNARSYAGKKFWLANMGYSEEGIGEVSVTFKQKGTFTLGSIYVECQPIEPVVDKLKELQRHSLTDIVTTSDSVTGTAHTESDLEYAFFTFGYSSGWVATVDGQPAEALKADTGFVAVPVRGAGDHEVKLTFTRPGSDLGAVISLAALAGVVAFVVIRKRKARPSGA